MTVRFLFSVCSLAVAVWLMTQCGIFRRRGQPFDMHLKEHAPRRCCLSLKNLTTPHVTLRRRRLYKWESPTASVNNVTYSYEVAAAIRMAEDFWSEKFGQLRSESLREHRENYVRAGLLLLW